MIALLLALTLVQPTPKAEKWSSEMAAFAKADVAKAHPPGGVVFVGSSSIRLWKLNDSFPMHPEYLNRGFGGSELADSVKHIDLLVLKHQPKAIVLYAGDNDLAAKKSPEKIRDDYKAFAAAVHAKLPNAKIIYIGVKPSGSRWHLADKAKETNRLVKAAMGDDPRQAMLDLWDEFLGPDGKPKPELYMVDRLHLSPAGYKLWTAKLPALLP